MNVGVVEQNILIKFYFSFIHFFMSPVYFQKLIHFANILNALF